jgi:hypothetical protein
MSTVQSATTASQLNALKTSKNAPAGLSGSSFAATLSSVSNGTKYSDAEVKRFFAGKPSAQQMADKASELGLTEAQIMQAMQVGGFAGGDANAAKAAIDGFVSSPNSGFSWGTSGALVASKSSVAQAATSSDKVLPAAADIKAFYATNPSEKQIVAKAKELGLTPAQMVQAEVTGEGMNMGQVSAAVIETMYVKAANSLGVDIGSQAAWNSYFSPTLGRAVSSSEMKSFLASNPSQTQIFQKASDLGIGVGALTNMMNGLGVPQTDATYGSLNNKMQTSLFQGRDAFSLDQYGHIVAGGGHQLLTAADGSGSWVPVAQGTTVNTTA